MQVHLFIYLFSVTFSAKIILLIYYIIIAAALAPLIKHYCNQLIINTTKQKIFIIMK